MRDPGAAACVVIELELASIKAPAPAGPNQPSWPLPVPKNGRHDDERTEGTLGTSPLGPALQARDTSRYPKQFPRSSPQQTSPPAARSISTTGRTGHENHRGSFWVAAVWDRLPRSCAEATSPTRYWEGRAEGSVTAPYCWRLKYFQPSSESGSGKVAR